MEQTEVKQSWSWLGFFFAPYYYAGYGNLQKGLILAVISGLPLLAIFIGVYGGLKAKKELPIGNKEFNWKNVGITVVVSIIVSLISMTAIEMIKG